MANGKIKQINTGTSVYDIDAAYLGSRSASDWEKMIHGAIDTYVVPKSKDTGSTATAYAKIVGKTDSTITLTQAELKSLVTPANAFKVGDVILLEAPSTDSKFMFDRWISAIAGTSDNSNITLAILETHVQTHHHTISDSKGNAVTGVTTTSTGVLAKVGTAVTVVTGVSGTPSVMTGVTYNGTGSHSIAVAAGSSGDGVGHSHSISGHTHTITPTALVSQNVDAYTYLSTSEFIPHSHGTASVAGAHKNSSQITYATGVSSVSGEYVVDLKEETINTGGTSNLITNSNATANTSSITVANASTIDNAKTALSGAHTHDVSTTTTEDVVKTVDLAPNVVTSVKYTAPTVAGTVVTSVPTKSQLVATSWSTAPTASFVTSAAWSCSVVSEVLTFNWSASTSSAVTSATKISVSANVTVVNGTISTTTQNSGSFTSTSDTQSHKSGKVSTTGSAASNGAHQHGFNHTHAIPTHTHSINSHTHTYVKTSVSSTGTPTVTLSTASHTPHTHTSVTVVSGTTNGTAISYVFGGTKTTVVRTLKSSTVDTGSQPLTTDTKYYKVTGTINLPTLKPDTAKLSTLLSTTSITPAVTGEAAVKTVSAPIASFVTDVVDKTSENKPGK